MSALFLKLLNMSIAAGWLVVAVIVLRLCLKKAPKAIHCALWALVAIRLICPLSLESSFSLIPEEVASGNAVSEWTDAYIGDIDIHHPSSVYYDAAIGAGREPISDGEGGYYVVTKHDQLGEPATIENTVVPVLSWVWLAGVAVLLLYAAVSYLRIRARVKVSLNWKDNIWRSEQVDSPFILGIIRPKIYLPFGMDEVQMSHVVAHEQAHLSRRDHWWKPLGFMLLAVYWFNPLMWVAYILLCRDIELACDEKVIRDMGAQDKKAYSEALLACSIPRRMIAACPLAFGEVGVKKRIASVLHYKKPAFWILIVALIASVAVAVCFLTNPAEEESSNEFITWEVNTEYPEAVVDIVNGYVMQQVEYYNSLGSGENAIGEEYSILEAKVVGLERRCRLMETETHLIELYRLEYRLLPSEPDHVVLAGGMQMEDGWITEYGSTGQPYFAILCDSTSGEESWTLMGMTNSDTINIEYNTDEMRTKHGDRYIAAAMELYKAYLRAEAQVSYDMAEDISYYLELAAGETFQNMNPERQVSLLVEYEDLLDDYSLIARETEDGKTAYIVGQYNGDPTQSPLHGMYSIDMYTGEEEYFRFLYREDEVETVEAVVAANKTEFPPSVGYRIEDSQIIWTDNSGCVLIQPKTNELLLDVPWNRYLHTPNGREYIEDAVSRGIDVCGRTDTFLYVYLISERFGEIAERIALTEAEAQAILAEEKVKITDGFGFSASLHIDGQTTYYNERKGIPQTVLDLAVEKCDYRFGDPSYITDTIREARLDCDWLDTALYAKEEDLPRLREILKNAKHDIVGACGYGAKLTLTFTGGEKLTVFKGCDSCDTIVFGSYGGYALGDKENTEFWEMFGLDPDTKVLVETNSADAKDEVLRLFNESTWRGATFHSRDFAPSNVVFGSPDTVTKIGRVFSSAQWEYVEAPESEPAWENLVAMYPFVFYDQGGLVRYGGPELGRDEPPMEEAVWYRAPGVFEAMQETTDTPFDSPAEPTAQPSDAVVRRALDDKHTEAMLHTYGEGNLAVADFVTCAFAHLAQEWENDTTYTFYINVFHAAYSFKDGKYDRVDEASVPTKLTFTFDGDWQLTELWTPGSTSSVGTVFPAEALKILERTGPEYYDPRTAECDDNAIRHYVEQTGAVPSKTFTPADVNFTTQALGVTQDEMTYEERLAWVQAEPVYGSLAKISLGQFTEGEGCLAYTGQWVGTPHMDQYALDIRFADGTTASLPLARSSYWGSALPDSMRFEGGKFIYETVFHDELLESEGQFLIHLKGTYHYEVDLVAKTVSLTVIQ